MISNIMKKLIALSVAALIFVTMSLAVADIKQDTKNWNRTRLPIIDCDKERKNDHIALACNIYHEARGESTKGQWMVALCTRNRVNSSEFPDTYADVIWDIRWSKKLGRRIAQFSWALDGRPDKIRDPKAWEDAKRIATLLIKYGDAIQDFTGGCLYYHADYVNPKWNKTYLAKIGKHLTYK